MSLLFSYIRWSTHVYFLLPYFVFCGTLTPATRHTVKNNNTTNIWFLTFSSGVFGFQRVDSAASSSRPSEHNTATDFQNKAFSWKSDFNLQQLYFTTRTTIIIIIICHVLSDCVGGGGALYFESLVCVGVMHTYRTYIYAYM